MSAPIDLTGDPMRLIQKPFSLVLTIALAALAPTTFASDLEVAGPLASALNSVSTQNISADIHFIASDELRGRDTPSPGLKIAARFIRARLSSLGLEPGADGSYFYEYPLDMARIDGEKTFAKFGERELVEGVDYFTWFRTSEHLDVQATMVWVGEESEENFEKSPLKGKWAVTTGLGRKRWRSARRRAQDAEAIGVIRILKDGVEANEDTFEGVKLAIEKSLVGSVSYPSSKASSARKRDATFPILYIRESTFSELTKHKPEDYATGALIDTVFQDKRTPDDEVTQVTLENVCGFWPGSDPVLANEVIIISAHYDHVGARGDVINNGADDNGSGTTGLLALSEALSTYGRLRRSVMVMWVSGEEKGLWGSKAWTQNPWLPEGCRPVANINIDMIGRNAADSLLVTPTREHSAYNGLTRLAERLAPLEGFPVLGDADAYYERSDHYNFRKNLEIPVAFLFSDIHEDYHKPTDTPDKIDCDKIRRVARLVMRMLDGMQDDVLEF